MHRPGEWYGSSVVHMACLSSVTATSRVQSMSLCEKANSLVTATFIGLLEPVQSIICNHRLRLYIRLQLPFKRNQTKTLHRKKYSFKKTMLKVKRFLRGYTRRRQKWNFENDVLKKSTEFIRKQGFFSQFQTFMWGNKWKAIRTCGRGWKTFLWTEAAKGHYICCVKDRVFFFCLSRPGKGRKNGGHYLIISN